MTQCGLMRHPWKFVLELPGLGLHCHDEQFSRHWYLLSSTLNVTLGAMAAILKY